MARKKLHTFPGTIYVPAGANRIYIEYYPQDGSKRKRIATGLRPTKEGYEVAETMLKKIYLQENKILRIHEPSEKETAPPKDIDFEAAFAEFLRVHGANKQPKTLDWYNDAFHKVFSKYTAQIMSDIIIEEAVVLFVTNSPLANSSVNIHLRAVQVFIGFCAQRGYVKMRNYASEFARKAQKKRIQTFTPAEIKSMLDYCRRNEKMDIAHLIQFLCETGFRIGQALTLQWTDIQDDLIYRRSKDQERNEPFPITTSLGELLAELPRFESKPNKVFYWENTSQASITKKLKSILKACNIPSAGRNWHTFRKTAATIWAEKGIPIQEVQKLLGHSKVEVTASYYVGVNVKELKSNWKMRVF